WYLTETSPSLGKLTPVYLAASQKHYAVVEHLLRAGAEIGWSTHWPIYHQLPEVLEAMMSEAQHSTDGIWRAFEYVSSAWYGIRSKVERDKRVGEDGKVKKGQLKLVEVVLQHGAYGGIDREDRLGFVNCALVALDCSAALALAQAGFASHGGDTHVDVDAFARACVSKLVSEKGFGDLREMLSIFLEARDIDWAEMDRSLEWHAKTEEQKRRACLLRKVSQGDIV
ncbi:ankyrin unc44, partial [Colletotrichum chrysophilum]